jgi:hypothetical protein
VELPHPAWRGEPPPAAGQRCTASDAKVRAAAATVLSAAWPGNQAELLPGLPRSAGSEQAELVEGPVAGEFVAPGSGEEQADTVGAGVSVRAVDQRLVGPLERVVPVRDRPSSVAQRPAVVSVDRVSLDLEGGDDEVADGPLVSAVDLIEPPCVGVERG